MTRFSTLLMPGLLFTIPQAQAQTSADSTALRQTALDYVKGWYTGDAERMGRAVHSKLVKGIVATHPKTGRQVFRDQDSTALVTATEKGCGTKTPEARR